MVWQNRARHLLASMRMGTGTAAGGELEWHQAMNLGKMQPRHTFSLRKKLGLGLQGCIQPDINVTTWCLPLSIVQCLIQIIGGFERCLAY